MKTHMNCIVIYIHVMFFFYMGGVGGWVGSVVCMCGLCLCCGINILNNIVMWYNTNWCMLYTNMNEHG